MSKFITYVGKNEVIVTTIEDEAETIRVGFGDGRRNLDDYERTAYHTDQCAIWVSSKVSAH